MTQRLTYRFLLFFSAVILLGACQRVVVTVDSIPSNTPKGQPVYITGNFNNWDPGDSRYQMQLNADSTYSIILPPGFGTIEYKFTRGDWTTVEKDICGYEINNRYVVIGEMDTAVNTIQSWNDLAPLNCPRLTLVVRNVPRETRPEDVIAIAGNYNNWSIDSSSIMKRDSSGSYSVTIDRPAGIEEIEFKLTRGDLASAESDEFGNMVPNRVLRFGVRDTISLNVDGWIDRPGKRGSQVILLIDKLPYGTPGNVEVFMANSLNGWMPGDRNYQFITNNKGQLYYRMARKRKPMEFKLTRGNWYTVEVDRYGYDIPNRVLDFDQGDTVRLTVEGWKDQSSVSDHEVTVVIDHLPSTTRAGESIYITGNLNGWNPGRSKYSFQTGPDGRPMINLPRENGWLEFKITRGSWRDIEVDAYGSQVPNRIYQYKDIDTLHISVVNWMDKPPYDLPDVTLVLSALPDNTLPGDELFLASELNGWNPGDPGQVFGRLDNGKPYITIPSNGQQFEYKITRGDWSTVETDEQGNQIPNRSLSFGFADTVNIRVERWADRGKNY